MTQQMCHICSKRVSSKMMKNVWVILLVFTVVSCGKYELSLDEEIISKNFIATMDENPENGFEIGTIDASSGYGRINYEILSQSPEGALAVSDKIVGGGVITVANSTLFDFETNPVIEARVRVYNPDDSDTVLVQLTMIDLEE